MDHAFYRNCSQAEIAKIFDTNSVNILRLIGDGLPYTYLGKKKVFDSAIVHQWFVERDLKKTVSKKNKSTTRKVGDDEGDLLEDDVEFQQGDNLDMFRYYKAKQAKLALEKEQGSLISKEAHEEFIRSAGDFVRSGFQALPKKLAVKLGKIRDSNDIESLLEEEIINTLKRLSEMELTEK